jgi:hypothetical protein
MNKYDEIKDLCQKARQELSNDMETLKMDTKQFKAHIYQLLEANDLLTKALGLACLKMTFHQNSVRYRIYTTPEFWIKEVEKKNNS